MKKTEFRVPSLSEADPVYKHLQERKWSLEQKLRDLVQEQDALRAALSTRPRVIYSDNVASLLGDDSGEQAETVRMMKRHRAIPQEVTDIETALFHIGRNLSEQRGVASAIITKAVRPEYGRRVSAVCDALLAVKAARAEYDAILRDFEVEDILWNSLDPMPLYFLGDVRDGHIDRVLRDAKEAGYHGN